MWTGSKTMIQKRYFHLTEAMLQRNPNLGSYGAPSLDARQDILVEEVPKLAAAAAEKALAEWGQPRSHITHLVFCTNSGVDWPGADYQLSKLLALRPSVNRVMVYKPGCYGGGTVLRVAKDLAENNRGARVLTVCCDITTAIFRGPSECDPDSLVGQALFGDGAAALIVGADPDAEGAAEQPIFELASAAQTLVPDSEGAIKAHLREAGTIIHLARSAAELISSNIERLLDEAFAPLGITDWNSVFWVAHPGGPAILDAIEAKAGLDKARLRATRHVLAEYGNMSSACVLFILDEMRKGSIQDRHTTTGEGMEWGVLFGFGPGITVETIVLRSVPNAEAN